MATSVYFQNYNLTGEQQLIEDLVIESIRIYGHDVYYIPKIIKNLDGIYGEDKVSEYNSAHFIEMYVKNVEGFGGEGDFLSKFNLQIRDQVTLTVAKRTFMNDVGGPESVIRPREGDLIYFPLNGKIFQIKFVEHEAIFYQLGALQTYDLTCELFEYSGEKFDTGITAIDQLERDHSINLSIYNILTESDLVLTDESGFPLIQEAYNMDAQEGDSLADNDEIQTESDAILDFTETDPFSEGNHRY